MSIYIVYSVIWLSIVLVAIWAAHPVYSSEDTNTPNWLTKIRKDHPRLFFNDETWQKVKQRALNQEREWYDRLKRRVDGYPEDPEIKDWGTEAAATAFVFRMTGEARYLILLCQLRW